MDLPVICTLTPEAIATRKAASLWELRHNLSAYDAVYVALAEVLDTRALTCDGPLARAPRSGAPRRARQTPGLKFDRSADMDYLT